MTPLTCHHLIPQIAIDSAIFPEGTTGAQLDVLARRALWKDGLNYLVCIPSDGAHFLCHLMSSCLQHGTGHGFGSFLNVHEGPHGFSSNVSLVPGHVITNEPGFCEPLNSCVFNVVGQRSLLLPTDLEGKWGMRIESALSVRRVKVRN